MKNEIVASTYSEITGITDDSIDIIDDLIVKCYKKVFLETSSPPSVHRVFLEATYEFEVSAYDLVYGIPEKAISEEWIGIYLGINKYVFEWGSLLYGSAQLRMFHNLFMGSEYEDEEYLEEVGLIGESEIRASRSEL